MGPLQRWRNSAGREPNESLGRGRRGKVWWCGVEIEAVHDRSLKLGRENPLTPSLCPK